MLFCANPKGAERWPSGLAAISESINPSHARGSEYSMLTLGLGRTHQMGKLTETTWLKVSVLRKLTRVISPQPWPDLWADFCVKLPFNMHHTAEYQQTSRRGAEKPLTVKRHSELKSGNREGKLQETQGRACNNLLCRDAQVSYCDSRFCPVHDNWAACRFSSSMWRHKWGEDRKLMLMLEIYFKLCSLRMCSWLRFFRDHKSMMLPQEWQVGAIIAILMLHQRWEQTDRPRICSKHACFGRECRVLGLQICAWWFLNECLWC